MGNGIRRSLQPITKSDLRRLTRIALLDLEALFARNPSLRIYRNRLIAIALCQGAALHYINRENGVKDFDVWCFFRSHPTRPFPYRRIKQVDFGNPKFGKSSGWSRFVGRRVDLLGRSLPARSVDLPTEALQRYLSAGRTTSTRALASKAMVLMYPESEIGRVAWPLCS